MNLVECLLLKELVGDCPSTRQLVFILDRSSGLIPNNNALTISTMNMHSYLTVSLGAEDTTVHSLDIDSLISQ